MVGSLLVSDLIEQFAPPGFMADFAVSIRDGATEIYTAGGTGAGEGRWDAPVEIELPGTQNGSRYCMPQRQAVHFVNNTVNIVRQSVTFFGDVGIVGKTTFYALDYGPLRADLQAPFSKLLDNCAVASGQFSTLDESD